MGKVVNKDVYTQPNIYKIGDVRVNTFGVRMYDADNNAASGACGQNQGAPTGTTPVCS